MLNAARRFRYTLDLKKEKEQEQLKGRIRTHAQVIRVRNISYDTWPLHSLFFVLWFFYKTSQAAILFREAGEKALPGDYNLRFWIILWLVSLNSFLVKQKFMFLVLFSKKIFWTFGWYRFYFWLCNIHYTCMRVPAYIIILLFISKRTVNHFKLVESHISFFYFHDSQYSMIAYLLHVDSHSFWHMVKMRPLKEGLVA